MITLSNKRKEYLFLALFLLAICLLWPFAMENSLFDIIVKIRKAIHSGDSGDLIMASMATCIHYAVPSILLFMSITYLGLYFFEHISVKTYIRNTLYTVAFIFIQWFASKLFSHPWEPVSSSLGLLITLVLVQLAKQDRKNTLPTVITSVLVFFSVQWFNIMPIFEKLTIGTSDIPVSIKIASNYMGNTSVINSVGFSFVIPLMLSSAMISMLFRMYSQNLSIVKENYEKAMALEIMTNKVMDNRVYQEINALAHDLKTPLVTIRGLNSLLTMSKDLRKLETYGERIEGAVSKMNEMISGFLYGTSRQAVEISDLINYIRAQIPIEDENIDFITDIEDELPALFINKVRCARALVNLIENAILAPNDNTNKTIRLSMIKEGDKIKIAIEDNGKGIHTEDMEKVWLIGHSTNNTSGLGLPFAKQTIEENDGTIELNSIYGKGTTALVYFPIREKGASNE